MFRARHLLALNAEPATRALLSERCYATAHAALLAGDDRAALQLFSALLVLAPRDARGWCGLALCSERRGLEEAARGLLELAATLASDQEGILQ
ncbi:MAG TPA: hypothetical protein VG937_01195 [Polyangiaceae bacterium]|nr:hypothetical protein [Polyangiaceae bacterium]